MRDAITDSKEYWLSRGGTQDAIEELAKYEEVMGLWKDKYPVGPSVEVEAAFEYPHPDDSSILLVGRPDRVAPLWGRLMHWQNRGLNASLNFGTYMELAKRHLHEGLYAWAMRKKYPDVPYGGTGFNLMRKLTYRGKPTKACPEGKILHGPDEIFFQDIIPFTEKRCEGILAEIKWYVDEMRRTRIEAQNGRIPYPNEKQNGGYFGNSIDPFFKVLEGEIDLEDNRYFKNREDMYTNVDS
jgi:hypothetical protein